MGVTVHSPIVRSEVPEVLRKQLEFKAELQINQNLTEDQAFLEITDIFDAFLHVLQKKINLILRESMHMKLVPL